jgi:hypothetical protein
MAEIGISSWTELQERLYEGTWQEPLGRFRGSFAFRGMTDASRDLRSSLVRLDPESRIETHMLRNFRKYAHGDAVPGDSVWNWLAVAQHHGMPTRLLDWTFSPLVACHFMTEQTSRFDLDGAIWRIDYTRVHELLPAPLRKILEEEDADVFTTEMLNRAAPTLQAFDQLADCPFAVFFEPPSLDERIVNQFALFSAMSKPTAGLEDFLREHPNVFTRIVVPAGLKWEIRDKLDQAGITERVLFPGLDGLSRWLTRYYTPTTRKSNADEPSPGGRAGGA